MLTVAGRGILYHTGIPKFEQSSYDPWLDAMFDLLSEVYSKGLCDFFTKGNYYGTINPILITQKFFHQGHFSRDLSRNSKNLLEKIILTRLPEICIRKTVTDS